MQLHVKFVHQTDDNKVRRKTSPSPPTRLGAIDTMQLKNAEVLAIPPVNAWLIMSDEASEPTPQQLRGRFTETEPANIWTGPPQARVGDLLLFYFKRPLKAIRYVARVASDPVFDSKIKANAVGEVSKQQWWVWYTPLVPVPEVSFKELAAMHSGHLVLKGRSGKYVSPDVMHQLLNTMWDRVAPHAAAELGSVVKVPLGDPDLPQPSTMTRAQWSAMADGAFTLEAKVEDYVVAPLLRFALGADSSLKTLRQYPAARGKADWGVVRKDLPTGVVETKIGVGKPGDAEKWMDSPAFIQLRRYMDVHDVPGLLIDARRMMLVDPGASGPSRTIDRRTATDTDIAAIGQHLGARIDAAQAETQIGTKTPKNQALIPENLLPTAEVKVQGDAQNEGAKNAVRAESLPSAAPAPAHQAVRPECNSDAEGLTQFVPAHTNVVGSKDILDALPHRQAAATVREQVKDVIETEGPIEVGRLARVIARRFGLIAVHPARTQDIIKLIPRGYLRKGPLGTFAWPTGLDPSIWAGFRLVDPEGTRSLDEVAPEEIANVMHSFQTEYPNSSDEEILRRTAEFFCIVRISANVRSRLVAVQANAATKSSSLTSRPTQR